MYCISYLRNCPSLPEWTTPSPASISWIAGDYKKANRLLQQLLEKKSNDHTKFVIDRYVRIKLWQKGSKTNAVVPYFSEEKRDKELCTNQLESKVVNDDISLVLLPVATVSVPEFIRLRSYRSAWVMQSGGPVRPYLSRLSP
jgi:hypothetical protein